MEISSDFDSNLEAVDDRSGGIFDIINAAHHFQLKRILVAKAHEDLRHAHAQFLAVLNASDPTDHFQGDQDYDDDPTPAVAAPQVNTNSQGTVKTTKAPKTPEPQKAGPAPAIRGRSSGPSRKAAQRQKPAPSSSKPRAATPEPKLRASDGLSLLVYRAEKPKIYFF